MQPAVTLEHHDPPLPPRAEVRDELHRRYFAEAGSAACRFGVTFARLMRHLDERSQLCEPIQTARLRFLDDMLHVIACLDGNGQAWADLHERYEQFLIRRCLHRGGQVDAALAAGRLFVELRKQADLPKANHPLSFWTYTGESPLRSWMSDRLRRIHDPHPTVTVTAANVQAGEPTIRVRTTKINLAQPIVTASIDGCHRFEPDGFHFYRIGPAAG